MLGYKACDTLIERSHILDEDLGAVTADERRDST